ncbi:hypothetical protein I317_00441 [Kwoniella heveanensis CBS 569]|nr:hypothetical protein I317_00441 [Kwoniella heveanensis CBS 569]
MRIGDFGLPTYRVIVPNPRTSKRGRGYRGMREEVVLETANRGEIDRLVREVKMLVGSSFGPMAVRHIINPSQARDEGIRLIWPEDGMEGYEEMQDWPRRDRLIRDGKTVRSASPPATIQVIPSYDYDGGDELFFVANANAVPGEESNGKFL